MKRATITDVARETGYSIATISLVINQKNVSIPDSTKEKVWEAVNRLNYRPNQLAVSMITKKTKVLGLIIPDNSNVFFADLSKSIERAARRAGYSLIYGNSDNDPKRDLAYMRMFADRQVDGIIFAKSASFFQKDGEKSLQFIKDSAIPLVTLDRHVDGSETRSVQLNNFKGGYLATRHLLELGHTRIGAFTGPNELVSSSARLDGYCSALEEAGVTFDERLVVEGDYQLGLEVKAAERFLNEKATAVFCFNDLMACGLYRELHEAGLSIPRDLSVVGFDNVFFSELIHPALTTIEQPVAAMGEGVVAALLDVIEGREVPPEQRNLVYEPKLVVRSSTKRRGDA